MAITKMSDLHRSSLNGSVHLEIRLFYIRLSQYHAESVSNNLILRHFHRDLGVSLEVNGSHVPELSPASLTLKLDRVDKENMEVTYVSTDSVRISGGVEFEVLDGRDVTLCGSLARVDDNWTNARFGPEADLSTAGWSMDCYAANLAVSSRSVEVYIAGCCSGVPVILTKTIQNSPRRKGLKPGPLATIPEDEEIWKEKKIDDEIVRRRNLQFVETDSDENDPDGKLGRHFYSAEMYDGEDGELSWFNAGVRVGVGIGLGMCVGIGIGVGLLMRTYQTTTRNFRRRFF
ncbi:hypothetical protein SAY87_010964 [Trapa incisa]|uniref:Erythronate-4-phosphate dehydrogenase family protein n=1 Tax=Trapa incisa TaxID=236973 RepID=A0AAN7JIE9_9MYRT|nr:hypothetical protein SAY87_010964 [Trapa incisa]